MFLIEIPLIFLVFPLIAAMLSGSTIGLKTAWYVGTAASLLFVNAITSVFGGPLVGFISLLVFSGTACFVAGSTNGVATPGSDTMKCPSCAESILSEAKKCRYCGELVPVDSVAEVEA